MAQLTIQSVAETGLEPAYAAVNDGDLLKADSSQRHFLHVKNGDASPTNVTINAVKTTARVSGVGVVTISDKVIAIAAGEERLIGPFTEAYMDADGDVTINYSNVTSITAAALKLPASY